MIVVEGPDGAGKSTLVHQISQEFGLQVGERGVADRDKLYTVTRQDTYNALSQAVAGGPVKVWDRLFISEFVYAGVVGRPCEFSDVDTAYITAVMEAISFPMIICCPPWGVVKANAAKAHQMKGVNENLSTIYAHYSHGDLPWPENHIWHDYTETEKNFATTNQALEEVAGYLQLRKERLRGLDITH